MQILHGCWCLVSVRFHGFNCFNIHIHVVTNRIICPACKVCINEVLKKIKHNSKMNRGAGRGALMHLLIEKSEKNSDHSNEAASSDSAKGSGSQITTDSGIKLSSYNSSRQTSGGRGRLLEILSNTSSDSPSSRSPPLSSSSGLKPAGRGRAFLLQNLGCIGVESVSSDRDYQSSSQGLKVITSKCSLENETDAPSEPIIEPVMKKGTAGKPVNAACNYIRLSYDKEKGVFEYEVRFEPDIYSRDMRIKLLNEHREKFGGTKTFDGATLYLPIKLPDVITNYQSTKNEDTINIQLIFKKKKAMKECIHLYNVLFGRIMKTLNYVRCDRKQFDPTAPKIIPQHKLEIWPGYVTAVDEYEDGIMLCCDVSHRILCSTTVLSFLADTYRKNPNSFQDDAKRALIGSVVLTRYNNKSYRIDDVDFNSNPLSTFRAGQRDIAFVDYYKAHYDIDIKDLRQPLLVSNQKRRVSNQETPEELTFSLIPEICHLTGLRDEMRQDHRVMRDIATYTRVSPNQRKLALDQFYNNINNSLQATEILKDWGLTLANNIERLVGRQLPEEKVYFAKKNFQIAANGDFGMYSTNNELIQVINLTDWILLYVEGNLRQAEAFLEHVEQNSKPMGIYVTKPQVHILPNDRTDTYVNGLRKYIRKETQIVVVIVPTSRDDRYAAIKKICCAEIPVPSQIINARTLSNASKNRSIVQKISLQMNCKLGGSLWQIRIPFENVMICGIDSYHDAGRRGNSVAAFVASSDQTYTKWYSKAVIQTKNEEIINGLCSCLQMSLTNYEKINKRLPDRIIIYRDGVGDGQLRLVREYEIPQLEKACQFKDPNYKPKLTFVVVQKRINTRLFVEGNKNGELINPNPGFILDHTITRKSMYDFFLVPQSVREGTVTPCHFVVVHDTADFDPNIVQRLSYKLCYLYYNWPGSVRVPACCQYAHKLAYLIGQSVKRTPAEALANKLFYL